jgi:two-component system sensor histidine kinase/response regulator
MTLDAIFAETAVLVVDDMAVMRDIIVRNLKLLGFRQVHTASSGQEALRRLDSFAIKLILSDWSMPGMSGFDLLKAVRADARLAGTPFVLVTGELQQEKVEQALRAGVSDFVLKPFTAALLGAKLGAVMNGSLRARAASAPAPVPALPTVLVVDDTPNNLTLVADLLRGDYKVKLAVRGDKALELAESAPPDLILLDIMMPQMDGFEVCRRLKDNPFTAHVPVIFLSALDQSSKIVEGLALGAVDYVTKPIEPAILKARVASALRLSQAHEQLRARYELMVENVRLRETVEQITRHDLTNPLAAIIGLSTALLTDAGLAPGAAEQVKAIERAAYSLLDLSQMSGALLKMEQGRYTVRREAVDLNALIVRIADETGQAFRGKRIGVTTLLAPSEAPVPLEGEALLLYSMLNNLVRNAAEASLEGDAVSIALAFDDQCRISVHNPGVVAPHIAPRFFEKYASFGKQHGSGLGTYSARMIARAHGGDIEMSSSAEHGTTLTVSLPFAPARADAVLAPDATLASAPAPAPPDVAPPDA